MRLADQPINAAHTARVANHYIMDLPESQPYHAQAMNSLRDELQDEMIDTVNNS